MKRVEGDKVRVVHINNTKKYKERVESAFSVCIVSEEEKEMEDWIKSKIVFLKWLRVMMKLCCLRS